jgi:penicillin amidase
VKSSRHGPIFFEDKTRHVAYAIRRAAAEPGTAPYLAGLRLAQAKDCRQFPRRGDVLEGADRELICGDTADNISWRPAALSPSRKGWTGRLPVPGAGEYEWQGFRKDLPSELNPPRGFIATANNNVNPARLRAPADVQERRHAVRSHHAVCGSCSRGRRRSSRWTITSGCSTTRIRCARRRTSALQRAGHRRTRRSRSARALIAAWDGVYTKDSVAAALYSRADTAPSIRETAGSCRGERHARAGGARCAHVTKTAAGPSEDGASSTRARSAIRC